MARLSQARYCARMASVPEDIRAAQALRHKAFIAGVGADQGVGERPQGRDTDRFDALCDHVLIEDRDTGRLAGCFRVLTLADGREIPTSYAAQFYELSALAAYRRPMIEMGRFCIDPERRDPDILRVAWAELTRIVDGRGAEMLFGCSSFQGCDASVYSDAFALLRDAHLAPPRWLPKVKSPDVFRFARRVKGKPDTRRALRTMPPLLRGYLAMGGWVSDHAVIDRALGTLHVFTGLEIGAIPPERARALRRVAQ